MRVPAPAASAVVIETLDDLTSRIGTTIGPSDTLSVDQETVDGFADLTDDHQWIHVDVERAAAGPFGGTVAHGYLTLSLLPRLARSLVAYTGFQATINYGLDRVRFPTPLRVGSVISARAQVQSAEQTARGIRAVTRYTIATHAEGAVVCVADSVSLLVGRD